MSDESTVADAARHMGRLEATLESHARENRDGLAAIKKAVQDLASKVTIQDSQLAKIESRLGSVESNAIRTSDRTEDAHRKIAQSSHDLKDFKTAVMIHVDTSGKAINAALDSQNEVLASIRASLEATRQRAEKRDEAVAYIIDSMKAREAAELMNAKETANLEAQRDRRVKQIAVITPAAAALVPLLKWIVELISQHH